MKTMHRPRYHVGRDDRDSSCGVGLVVYDDAGGRFPLDGAGRARALRRRQGLAAKMFVPPNGADASLVGATVLGHIALVPSGASRRQRPTPTL